MGYIVLCQIYIVTHLVLQLIKVNKQIAALPIRPAQAVVLSFGIVILFGTFLLSLPRAVYGKQLSFIDALFTATSAVCVTGLNVVSLGDTFTYFGQGVILVLIQLGGLGLMTITAFFALVISRDLGIREHLLLRDILNYEILGNITRLLKYILGLTFICEGIGAVLFFLKWRSLFPESIAQAIYYSVFHAISAFCNAGFCLFENSFASFQGDIGTLGITAALIIIGGLGFAVVMNVLNLRIFTRKKRLFALTLQSKLVLIISGSLLILGTVVLLGLESENALKDFSFRKRLLTAFFHSVTARTAGFSTIDIGELSQGAILFLILLMFIGASPGSTGGGVKTSTIGLVLVALWNICCGRTKVELFKRNISWEIVNKAFVIVIIALIFIFLSTILLAVIEKSRPFMELLFEVFSAFGTVGLSCGVTPLLSPVGKAILVVTMFAGRIGPLTLALAIGQRVVKEHYQYPQAAIMIG
jgi:trk system potassium uptake protein TrkH